MSNPPIDSFDRWEAPPLTEHPTQPGAETGYLASPVTQSQQQAVFDLYASLLPELGNLDYPLPDPTLFPEAGFDTESPPVPGVFDFGYMDQSA